MGKRPKVLESQRVTQVPPHKKNNRDEILSRIERCNVVIQHLKHNPGWEVVIDDFEKTIQRCDETWHLIPRDQANKLEEFRIMKLAATSIISAFANYEHDLQTAEKELYIIDNPSKVVAKDYDDE